MPDLCVQFSSKNQRRETAMSNEGVRTTRYLLLIILALCLAACGDNAAVPAKSPTPAASEPTGGTPSVAGPTGTETFPMPTNRHVQPPISYAQIPPVGGDHAPVWQNCGFYDTPIASETAIHSLEHGAVWITYQPNLPNEQIGVLRDLARQPFVLVSPFPDLPIPMVASACGRQLRLDSATDPRLAQFLGAFRNGPQTPEPGAPCTGGVGAPTQ
jgi:hypothetical protein